MCSFNKIDLCACKLMCGLAWCCRARRARSLTECNSTLSWRPFLGGIGSTSALLRRPGFHVSSLGLHIPGYGRRSLTSTLSALEVWLCCTTYCKRCSGVCWACICLDLPGSASASITCRESTAQLVLHLRKAVNHQYGVVRDHYNVRSQSTNGTSCTAVAGTQHLNPKRL
jgi:hypothetical protein